MNSKQLCRLRIITTPPKINSVVQGSEGFCFLFCRHLEKTKNVLVSAVAVTGTDYGGFTSILAVGGISNSPFKCGVAVAPIVNWKLYGY